jgi:hypothetical protein
MTRCLLALTNALAVAIIAGHGSTSTLAQGESFRFSVTLPPTMSSSVDGRLLLIVSRLDGAEPRFQVSDGAAGQPVFGIDVDNWAASPPARIRSRPCSIATRPSNAAMGTR